MGCDASSFIVSHNHYFKSGVQKRDPNGLLAPRQIDRGRLFFTWLISPGVGGLQVRFSTIFFGI